MSQDMRRERAGVRFETIAGASDYIAKLEAMRDRVIEELRKHCRLEVQELRACEASLSDPREWMRHEIRGERHLGAIRALRAVLDDAKLASDIWNESNDV